MSKFKVTNLGISQVFSTCIRVERLNAEAKNEFGLIKDLKHGDKLSNCIHSLAEAHLVEVIVDSWMGEITVNGSDLNSVVKCGIEIETLLHGESND